MAVNRSILPDGSLGYRAGTEGKTYKRVQDARIQDKKLSADKSGKKGGQTIKSVVEALSTKGYTEDDINSVADLKEFYKHCSYGLIDFKANKPWKETHKNTTFEDWEKEWRLLSVEQLLKSKCGICYDTAKANDYFLNKWKIDHVNLFAYTKRSAGDDYNDDPTHTFTVYKDTDGKWKWLEGSWGSFKNNDWSESSSDALIKNIGKALANEAGVTNLIGVITSWPRDGVSMNEFYHALKDQAIKKYKYEIKPDASYSKEAMDTILSDDVLKVAQEQRRIKHLKDLAGPGASTTLKRLRYAQILPILTTALAGAGVGAAAGAGYIRKGDEGAGAAGGALLGGGIGLLAGLLANGIGSVAGNFSNMPREELQKRIQGLGAADYLIPGRGSYLGAQLYKDFEENEENTPQQMVF